MPFTDRAPWMCSLAMMRAGSAAAWGVGGRATVLTRSTGDASCFGIGAGVGLAGHGAGLHTRNKGPPPAPGHRRPPFAARRSTVATRRWVPPPHVRSHAPQAPSEYAQSTGHRCTMASSFAAAGMTRTSRRAGHSAPPLAASCSTARERSCTEAAAESVRHGSDCAQWPHRLTVQSVPGSLGEGVGRGVGCGGAAVVVRTTAGVGPGVGLRVLQACMLQTRETIRVHTLLAGKWNRCCGGCLRALALAGSGTGTRHCRPPPQATLHFDHGDSASRSSHSSSQAMLCRQFWGV